MRSRNIVFFLVIIASLLAACTAGAPGSSSTEIPGTPAPTEAAAPEISVITEAVDKVPTDTPVPTPDPNQTTIPEAATNVIKILADRLGVSVGEIKVASVEQVQWPDGCLGAAKPDEMCTQAMVDGYRIILQANGKSYEFRTNMTGSAVREVEMQSPTGGKIITSAALSSARHFLAQELGREIGEIKLQSAKQAEWPNSCLGAAKAGQVCAEVITPGFQFVFLVDGQPYEVRTDNEGSAVALAQKEAAVISGIVVSFERTENGTCSRLEVGEKTRFGPCSGTLTEANLSSARLDELNELFVTFDPFSAETTAGKIEFQGKGSASATDAEQRSMAEWAWMVLQEAQSGRSGADWGLVMAWHREGGLAGFCDDLAIYASGWAYVDSCRSNAAKERKVYRFSPEELEQLFAWVDQLGSTEVTQADPAGAADAMSITLSFNGAGTEQAAEAEQQELLDFAQNIFNEAPR
jgi:hypothetical protein